MRDTPASLSKSLWDALDNWVQQRTLFFITKYVTSLPVSLLPSNGQGADVMHRSTAVSLVSRHVQQARKHLKMLAVPAA
eukprot:5620500-Amphidinium_carterae.1